MRKTTIWLILIGTALMLIAAQSASAQGTPPTKAPNGKIPSKVPTIVKNAVDQLAQGETLDSTGVLKSSQDGRLRLEFHSTGSVGASEKADLEKLGASIESSTDGISWHFAMPSGLGVIAAWVPYPQVEAASRLPWVAAVLPLEENSPDAGPIMSEGVLLHDADTLHGLGIDGTGVTVGAISDGVTSIAAAQAANELPGVNVLSPGSGDEGTAMLEIIHDMAPGAALAFHSTGGGTVNHIIAQNNLAAAGAGVIVEDIAFDAEPAFQQGAVARNGDNLAAAGISVHSSAGNRGTNHAARVPAVPVAPTDVTGFTNCGPFFDANSNVVDIDPGLGTSFDIELGGGNFSSILQWSEPRAIFPTAGAGGFTDMDLYLMNQAGDTCLGSSTAPQGFGQGDTIEGVAGSGGGGLTVKLVVVYFGDFGSQTAPTIDLRWRGATAVDPPTRAGSLNPDSNYTGQATSSGAANTGPFGGSTDPSVAPLESFSSGGPVTLGVTTVCPGGVYPCPGSSVAGPGQASFDAPNWTAADGGSVSGAGGFGAGACPAASQGDCVFFGTSAAAPHAAGAAALLLDADSSLTPADINTTLGNAAFDIAGPGYDFDSGFGILQVDAAVKSLNDISINNGPSSSSNPVDSEAASTLSVTASDILGLTLDYSWAANCPTLPSNGTFSDSNIENPVWTAPLNETGTPQDCQIDVTVGDPLSNSNTDNFIQTVKEASSVFLCNGLPATIVGTDGPDVINGTAGDDVIVGLDGDDVINGLDGLDTICGGNGNDQISGGAKKDWISGDGGSDDLTGNKGNDRLIGGRGKDTLTGGKGKDKLLGGSKNDLLFGGAGKDRLWGGKGNDTLSGEGKDDRIKGQKGDDAMECGGGIDTANGGPGTGDTATPDCESVLNVP